ncbi:MAG: hypothetical protein ACR2NY_01380 [Alphaproteobacteria bacterium]
MNDHQLIKFFFDNATGLSVSIISLYLMFRLFDKHLVRLTQHLEALHRLVIILYNRGERYQQETEKTLERIEQKLEQKITEDSTKKILKDVLKNNSQSHSRQDKSSTDWVIHHPPIAKNNKENFIP